MTAAPLTTARVLPRPAALTVGGALCLSAAVMSGAAAVIHRAAMAAHAEHPRMVVALGALAFAQAAIATVLVAGATPRALRAIVVASGALLLLWAASRTVGLPLSDAGMEPEAVGLADATAALLQVGVGVCAAFALADPASTRRPRWAVQAVAGCLAVVLPLSVAALGDVAQHGGHPASAAQPTTGAVHAHP